MQQHPNDICDLILPVFMVWKYTGLPVYRLEGQVGTEGRQFSAVKSKSMYLGILFYLIWLWIYIKIILAVDADKFWVEIEIWEICFHFVHNIGIIFVCHKTKENIGTIPSELLLNEKRVWSITKTKIMYYHDVKNYFLKIVLVKYGLTITTYTAEFITSATNKLNITFYYVTWILQFHSQILIILYLIILREQYRHLNYYLQTDQIIDCKITKIIELHSSLRKLVTSIKKCFSGYILLKILMDLICTSTGICYYVNSMLSNNESYNALSWIMALMWFALVIIVDFTIVIILEAILDQVCET
jgi:hypothetical protein